ncbi:MAG: amidohydrolase family protein [Flavobacteriales bacterium]|nr:amidohydrolase family protein [Flavobacteriales bacterium]
MRTALLQILLLLAASAVAQRPAPAPPQQRSVLITNATVHVGDGRVIEEGAVGFRNGNIDYVGYAYGVRGTYDTTVQAAGGHLYPGLILADNTLGLHEIDLVRATNDEAEHGEMTPEVHALTAYAADSRTTPTVRANGVLLAQITPRSGLVSGVSAVVQLDAWDNEDAPVRARDGLHVNWPSAYSRSGWWAEPGSTNRAKDEERQRRIRELRLLFQRARAYGHDSTRVKDVQLDAVAGVFDGRMALYLHAQAAREIQEAVLFAKEFNIPRPVIVGGYDAWRVADLLADRKVPVILARTHSLPLRDDDPVDLPYRIPYLLSERGVRFCLSYTGEHERMGARNLPFTAGTASAHGLDREWALRAITLDAAFILGIDKRYGSLETGKSATLFLSTGDALDMRGNNVTLAFIDGRMIVLDDHQKVLYRQYLAR